MTLTHLFQLGGEPDGPQVVADDDDMNQIDQHEDGVPEKGVKGAQNHPAPQTEEHTPNSEGDPKVEDAVDAVRGQVGEEEEDIRQLEVDMVDR